MVLVSLNRYDRELFNKSEPLASLDSVAQLASDGDVLALLERRYAIRYLLERLALGVAVAGPAGPEREALCVTRTRH